MSFDSSQRIDSPPSVNIRTDDVKRSPGVVADQDPPPSAVDIDPETGAMQFTGYTDTDPQAYLGEWKKHKANAKVYDAALRDLLNANVDEKVARELLDAQVLGAAKPSAGLVS